LSPPRVHLRAGLAVLALTGVLGWAWTGHARRVEERFIHALAADIVPEAIAGEALARAALGQPNLLLAYGSSELISGAGERDYSASRIFRTYPTGFNVFTIARNSRNSLLIAQDLAAAGEALRGRKVVVSFTPWMFVDQQITQKKYAGNFSLLHAQELAFGAGLSYATRRRAARRMLGYLGTTERDPLLHFALRLLAGGSVLQRALFAALEPLGRLETMIVRLQDHAECLAYLRGRPKLDPAVPTAPAAVDWAAIEAHAEKEQVAHSATNPYGIEDMIWMKGLRAWRTNPGSAGSQDAKIIRLLQDSREWEDLDIMLSVLRELGARPLLLSRPINGPVWDAQGISHTARKVYYDKLHRAAAFRGVPVVAFEDHDSDLHFSRDFFSHTSRKGWVDVDEVLDAFYHDTLR